jgi:hypothetical protein
VKKKQSRFDKAVQLDMIKNTMSYPSQFSFSSYPQTQSLTGQQMLSQADTIFNNLRFYLVSNFRQILSQAYVEIGLVRTVCDIPVDDALRGGVEIKSKQLDETQIEELLTSIERDDDLQIAGQAAKWNRLFGGAGILILTDQDPELPLDIHAIGPDEKLEFRAVDMWELFWDKQSADGYTEGFQDHETEFFSFYGEQVHKSRVVKIKGQEAPSFIRPRLRGWGTSVVELLVRSVNQYLKSSNISFEVLDEFKLDIFRFKNLVDTLLMPGGEEKVRQRTWVANQQKNFQHALILDLDDEYDHKQLSFAGLGEVMKEIRIQVAADMRFPLTKLFGISAAGFNSGQDDIEVYNGMVEGEVRNKIKKAVVKMLEIKCQQMFGFIPDDLKVSFKPLRILTAVDEEGVKTQKFARLQQAKTAGDIDDVEYREAINKGNLMDISLDVNKQVIGPQDLMAGMAGMGGAPVPPGAPQPGKDGVVMQGMKTPAAPGMKKPPTTAANPPPAAKEAKTPPKV